MRKVSFETDAVIVAKWLERCIISEEKARVKILGTEDVGFEDIRNTFKQEHEIQLAAYPEEMHKMRVKWIGHQVHIDYKAYLASGWGPKSDDYEDLSCDIHGMGGSIRRRLRKLPPIDKENRGEVPEAQYGLYPVFMSNPSVLEYVSVARFLRVLHFFSCKHLEFSLHRIVCFRYLDLKCDYVSRKLKEFAQEYLLIDVNIRVDGLSLTFFTQGTFFYHRYNDYDDYFSPLIPIGSGLLVNLYGEFMKSDLEAAVVTALCSRGLKNFAYDIAVISANTIVSPTYLDGTTNSLILELYSIANSRSLRFLQLYFMLRCLPSRKRAVSTDEDDVWGSRDTID